MKMRFLLAFFVMMFVHLLVMPVIACNHDECHAQCETERSQCLEQLSTTLDPQKQDEINTQCEQNYTKCMEDCRSCEE